MCVPTPSATSAFMCALTASPHLTHSRSLEMVLYSFRQRRCTKKYAISRLYCIRGFNVSLSVRSPSLQTPELCHPWVEVLLRTCALPDTIYPSYLLLRRTSTRRCATRAHPPPARICLSPATHHHRRLHNGVQRSDSFQSARFRQQTCTTLPVLSAKRFFPGFRVCALRIRANKHKYSVYVYTVENGLDGATGEHRSCCGYAEHKRITSARLKWNYVCVVCVCVCICLDQSVRVCVLHDPTLQRLDHVPKRLCTWMRCEVPSDVYYARACGCRFHDTCWKCLQRPGIKACLNELKAYYRIPCFMIHFDW